MENMKNDSYALLIRFISEIDDVLSIGKSGGSELPENGESDIDIYIFCNRIPEISKRREAVEKLDDKISIKAAYSDSAGKFWGTIDFINMEKTEICLMYFTDSYMDNEIEFVLNGTRLDKEAGIFYPTGRCATMLSIHALYDKSCYIAKMKERLAVYPNDLSEKMFNYHVEKIIDEENFERAVLRNDILFYHETVENAIDHFLQALFALNKSFMPSRKRTMQYINSFKKKPANCIERLLQVIELGAKAETLHRSYVIINSLYNELNNLGSRIE